MEALKFSEEGLRFRVYREQGEVKFFGSLGDTTHLAMLDGVLTNGSVCDLSGMSFASWNGLATLGSYIQSKNFLVSFKALPFQIYDSLRIMKCYQEQTIESAELPCVEINKGVVHFEVINLQNLRKSAEGTEEWVYPRPGVLLLVPLRYVFPDLLVKRSTGHLPLEVKTTRMDIASFWLQYASFCQSTIEISICLIQAAKINVLNILNEIKAKMSAGEQALKLLDPRMSYTLVHRLDGMITEIDRDFDGLSEKIQDKFVELLAKLGNLSVKALQKGCELDTFSLTLKDYAEAITSLISIESTCEDSGSAIGGRFSSLRSTQVLKTALANVSNPSAESIAAIRDAFAIMDMMSEDDWFATRELVMAEIGLIETLIGRCVVTLQVFDMMRQILDHRIREMELVVNAFKENGGEALLSSDLKDAVLGKIGAHLVTEQEKAAFSFYLPDGFEQFGQSERKEPGDVLLF
jgi:hypothetical protein